MSKQVRYVADHEQMPNCEATLTLRCSTDHDVHGHHERQREIECIDCGTFHDFVLEDEDNEGMNIHDAIRELEEELGIGPSDEFDEIGRRVARLRD